MNSGQKDIRVLFSGDYHTYGPFDKFIRENPGHRVFDKEVAELVSKSDLSIFNLEDPLTKSRAGIIKYGPYGVGSRESLLAVQKAGFNLATFATNHTYDMKNEGIKNTLEACRELGIDITGAGMTREEARGIYYRKIGQYRLAVLNFARVEFNVATDDHGGANHLDLIENTKDILEAKSKADFVFVVVHDGLDLFHLPYPKLVSQMRFYTEMGADGIIIHHSRLISGYEIYKGKPIFYGLGNLLHLTANQNEHCGIMVEFTIRGNRNVDFNIFPVELDKNSVSVRFPGIEKSNKILAEIKEYSEVIHNDRILNSKWSEYVTKNKGSILSILSGHPRILYRIAKKFRLIKLYERILLLNKNKYLAVWNLARCQSHFESMNHLLIQLFKEDQK